jgi:hypothetical protein
MKIVRYDSSYKAIWNNFLDSAKNTHFFFHRDYLEYHSHRFQDFSLLVFNNRDRLIALLPANIENNIFYSHQGITFGGFIFSNKIKTPMVMEIFNLLYQYLKNLGISKLIYKVAPYIYHLLPSEEDRYALFRLDAKLIRRDLSSTINLSKEIKYSKLRKRVLNRAKRANLEISLSYDYKQFWNLLTEVLKREHNTTPVHTLDEIELLSNRFKENIKLYIVKRDMEILAGVVIYENRDVVHTQYLASGKSGRDIGALDLLIDYLIRVVYRDRRYFDFGISTEREGRYLNRGLVLQKEGFGARAVVYDFYEVDIL